jgi:hypothetical protein
VKNSISKKPTQEWLALKSLIGNMNTVDSAFDELRADVQKLLNPPSPEKTLLAILNKITRMGFNRSRRTIVPLPHVPTEKRNRLRLGNEWFIVADIPRLKGGSRDRKRQIGYWLLDQTLKSGEFSQIRHCALGSCRNYFASTRKDRLTCSAECNVKRQNAKRQNSDGTLDKYTLERWKKRRRAVKRALELERQGCAAQEIQRKTGLSERVFRRERSGRGLVALLELAEEREGK